MRGLGRMIVACIFANLSLCVMTFGKKPMNKILISACLMGFNVRYDGSAKSLLHSTLAQWRSEGRVVTCCPELAAGFSTPRPAAEIIIGPTGSTRMQHGARVMERTGTDVTDLYILGAHLALRMAQLHHCRYALLADGSPSCGSETIYSGDFDGQPIPGMGFTAQILREQGIAVFSHRQVDQLVTSLRQDEEKNRP